MDNNIQVVDVFFLTVANRKKQYTEKQLPYS